VKSPLYPLRIEPRFVERIWGGMALATELGKPAPADKPIGESWEIYDENRVLNGELAGQTIAELRGTMGRELTGHVSPEALFPLLTKLIDAREALSVQVHPDDSFACLLEGEPNGKTECWYVIEATPGAELTYGFARATSADEYAGLVAEGRLENVLRSLPVRAGDVVYIPAGTVHAIGAGIVLFELQQTSDVTYRIYDWNRRDAAGKSRELHVDKAQQVLNFDRETAGIVRPLRHAGSSCSTLVAAPYFSLEKVEATGEQISTYNSPVGVCALSQALTVSVGDISVVLDRYSSLVIPAAAGTYTIADADTGESGSALVAYVPESETAMRDELIRRGYAPEEVQAFVSQFVETKREVESTAE
jgi:mannose-6-phosphate isomerase